MMHLFLQPGAWFAPKRYGYGAGLPIAWQGWALTFAYVGGIAGAALMVDRNLTLVDNVAIGAGMAVLTGLYVIILARRTQGGFRWRWGG